VPKPPLPAPPGRLAPGDVELWSVDLDLDRPDEDGRGGGVWQLSEQEQARAARMRLDADRRSFVASHLWLRRLLADRLGVAPARIEYATSGTGKPELASPSLPRLCFSMSRSGGLALYAFALGREIGIDVEECRAGSDLAGMERRFLAPAEQAVLSGMVGPERREAFYRTWTRKEAFLKAIGVGLSVPWAAVDTTGDVVRLEREVGGIEMGDESWSLRDLEVGPSYAAAVSVEGSFGDAPLRVRPAGAGSTG